MNIELEYYRPVSHVKQLRTIKESNQLSLIWRIMWLRANWYHLCCKELIERVPTV